MPRRPANLTPRRLAESGISDSFNPAAAPIKSQTSPFVSVCLVFLGVIILLGYSFSSSSFHHSHKNDTGNFARETQHGAEVQDTLMETIEDEGGAFSFRPECRAVVCRALPLLHEIYGESMKHALHIGPSTCGVVLKLLKQEKVEAWGILPCDPSPPVHSVCENLIRKGLIRVADVSQSLLYRSQSFSIVLASNVVDTMNTKQLNTTLRELTRVSSEGIVLFINSKAGQRMEESLCETIKPSKLVKPRSKVWWQHRFEMLGLQESEETTKKFESLQSEKSMKHNYYVFHLLPLESTRR